MSDRRTTYLALSALAARYAAHADGPRPGPAGDLTPSELKVFSQNGEDGVIEAILGRIGHGPASFVEFGVESGVEGNCVFLADVLGWRGLFMEADEGRFAALSGKYEHRPEVRTTHAAVGPGNIDRLVREAGLADGPAVLSIDVDGIDYWIWRASELRPRLVVIEYNAHLRPEEQLVQPLEPAVAWDETDYFGASLGALRALATAKGYRLVHTDLAGVNAFFVREDLAQGFGPEAGVPVRAPNYSLIGARHRPHTGGRRYVDPSG
ncbi:hypothetical protein [Miltoncostaea marina]|uniref:hypothetical protein n=1 Tax=Miltoncostaea marina TaxID=2843215 RepID=UPI001C3DE808|nr:hypothetical protein [Miltoncostaea marina]